MKKPDFIILLSGLEPEESCMLIENGLQKIYLNFIDYYGTLKEILLTLRLDQIDLKFANKNLHLLYPTYALNEISNLKSVGKG